MTDIKYNLVETETFSVLTIYDSYRVSKHDFDDVLSWIEYQEDRDRGWMIFDDESRIMMKMEWTVHNFLYNIGIERERTKDCDFDYPKKWYYLVGYAIGGVVCWLFIK